MLDIIFKFIKILSCLFFTFAVSSFLYAVSNESIIEPENESRYDVYKNNYFIKIEKNIKMERFRKAEKLLNEFSANYPEANERKYYYFYAVVNEFKGELINAIRNYKKAIELNSEYSQARNNLGLLYFELGIYKKSEDQFLAAVKVNPYSPFINYNLGDLYLATGKMEEAERYLKNACNYKANFGEAFYKLGLLNYKTKEYSKALHNFSKAVEFNYYSHEIYYYLGSTHNKLDNTDLAISNLLKAVDIEDDSSVPLVELGKIYRDHKDYKNAMKYYRRAESIDFEDLNIRLAIAECYIGMKRYDDAIDIIESLVEMRTDKENLKNLLAKIKEKKSFNN